MALRVLWVGGARGSFDRARSGMPEAELAVVEDLGGALGQLGHADVVLVPIAAEDALEPLGELFARAAAENVAVIALVPARELGLAQLALEAGATDALSEGASPALLARRVALFAGMRAAATKAAELDASLAKERFENRDMLELLAHDLKNPLAVVAMNVGWGCEQVGDESPDLHEALLDAQTGCTKLQQMIDDVLVATRLEQGKAILKRSRVRLDAFVGPAVEAVREEATTKRVNLAAGAPPPVYLEGDAQQLGRALQVLLENSVRHAPNGGRVELSFEVGAELCCTVANNGGAVPAASAARLFQKLCRAPGEPKPAGAMGLGFFFCHQVAVAHGGRVRLASSPAWPVELHLELPLSS